MSRAVCQRFRGRKPATSTSPRASALSPRCEVRGTVNPFAQALDARPHGEGDRRRLPPLSTYSGKYAGYGITKGALSFDVHYKIDNRRLTASNKLVLDQLTFGEHVDSPSATKLPICSRSRCSRTATAPSISTCRCRLARRSRVLRVRNRRPDHRQPHHQGDHAPFALIGGDRREPRR
jgi:hypothetical protein